MAFDPRIDLSLLHDWWADGPEVPASPFQTWPDGVGSDDLVGANVDSWGLFAGPNGKTAAKCKTGSSASVTFGSPIAQPADIFIVGTPQSAAYVAGRNILNTGPIGTGIDLGWAGGGRWSIDVGSAVQAPDDLRLPENVPFVLHVHLDGAASEVRIDGSLYWSGDFGSDDIDSLTINTDYFYYARVLVSAGLLSAIDISDVLLYFNGEYARPDWATSRRAVALVVDTATPAEDSTEAFLRYAIEQRGHTVDVFASSSLDLDALKLYAVVAYAGAYADRASAGPIIRALIDAAVPCWISLREQGMGAGFPTLYTDSVAVQCDVASRVGCYHSAGWNQIQTVTTHPITDFLGAPPVVVDHQVAAGDFGIVQAADTAVGTVIATLSGIEVMFAAPAGTADLSAIDLAAPVVLSGVDFTSSPKFWRNLGRQLFQHEIDWLLDAITPPNLPIATTGLRLLSPQLGQIVDPSAGDVSFSWTDRAGRTAEVFVCSDITNPTWVSVGTTALTVTTLVADLSDPAVWPEGIWYGWRVVWDDAVAWVSPGFKLLSGGTTDANGTVHVTGIDEAHAYIAFDPVTVPGGGANLASFLWDSTGQWWEPNGAPHEYMGLAAGVLSGAQNLGLQIPPDLPNGFKHYEISAYGRFGWLNSYAIGSSTRYYGAEGQTCALGAYASGTDADSVGIAAGFTMANLYAPYGCPGEGTGNFYFGIGYQSAPGVVSLVLASMPSVSAYAWNSPCAVDGGMVPIRMSIRQLSATRARVWAGVAGFGGSAYWLVEQDIDFDFTAVGDEIGWALGKLLSACDACGFRDMYSLSVSGSDSAPVIAPPDDTEPSKPCILELTGYEADRTTEWWKATNDPADPADVQILMEPSSYGSQIVDFLQGSASIGTVTVGLIDPPTIAGDQDSGIMTGRLADALGRGAIKGRRWRLRRFISVTDGWVTIVDGDGMEPFLNDSYSSVSFAIRDTRERERKTKAFQRGETTSLLPMGRFHPDTVGVSQPAFGSSINNVIALSGFVNHGTGSGFVFPGGYYQPGTPGHVTVTLSGWSSPPPSGFVVGSEQLVVFPEAEEQFAGQIDYASPAGVNLTYPVIYPKVVIWWRERFTSDPWTKLKPRFEAVGNYAHPVGTTAQPIPPCVTVFDATFLGEDVRGAYEVLLAPIGSSSLLPADGLEINLLIQYIGSPTDSMPFHWSGTLGEMLQAAYDGEFSPKAPTIPADPYAYDPGTAISTGIRYDAAVLATMTETVLLRVTEPVDDLRDWLEKYAYAPSGWAPALDRDGQISPIHQRFPTSTAGLLTVDNSIAKAEPGWAHGTTIINLIQFKYHRVFLQPIDENGIPVGYVDGLQLQEIERWYAAAGGNLPIAVTGPEFLPSVSDSIALFGERQQTFEARAFHVDQAIGLAFDPNTEQPAILAAERADTILPRYAFGTPVVAVAVRREPTATLRAGNWVGLDLSWMPEYRTGRRGLQRYAQIFELPDLNCAWRRLHMELGEALNLRTYSGHSGGGSGGSAPYSSVPYTPSAPVPPPVYAGIPYAGGPY
jgi:hypothetical protein